jgi:hypothetical protein
VELYIGEGFGKRSNTSLQNVLAEYHRQRIIGKEISTHPTVELTLLSQHNGQSCATLSMG